MSDGPTTEHLDDSGQSPTDALGNPREHAASLHLGALGEGRGPRGSLLAVFVALASFGAFGISATRWIGGENDSGMIIWALGSGAVLLVASVWLTVITARQVVEAAVRERLIGADAGALSRWAPMAIAAPWVFPVFAAALVAGSALRA